jgi:pilus assembly protein Flp/PilA
MSRPNIFLRLLRDQSGATALEYGLICGLIVIAMVGALTGFADENHNTWIKVSQSVMQASNQSAN